MGEKRNAYKILVGEPEGKKQLGRRRYKWVDNNKIDPSKIGWGDMDWIDLAQDGDQWRTLVNTLMKLLVPLSSGKFLSSCTIGNFPRRGQIHEVS
jgi:hypothetical protein